MSERNTRILLVDDSDTDAELIRSHLAKAFDDRMFLERVSSLAGAKDVLLLGPLSFDLVLLDLTLPDSSGVDTLANLLPYAASIPVVVVTGDSDAQYVVRLAGASEFVAKGDFSAVVAVSAALEICSVWVVNVRQEPARRGDTTWKLRSSLLLTILLMELKKLSNSPDRISVRIVMEPQVQKVQAPENARLVEVKARSQGAADFSRWSLHVLNAAAQARL